MIGKTLGHYEITALLGKGGMGEVYRAHDGRLGRDVAIKVLPESIAQRPELQSRFQREATTISSLNHPHICVLHDVGQEEDVRFLVMELVEGLTLSDRLREGPLPTEEVLRYGMQIADALDRAHRAGIVHRDLKPGNVMITRSGAKLMDFGLARVSEPESNRPDATVAQGAASPTEADPLTAEGALVGTFQYMAPEHVQGRGVDARADLWALGCLLYEMATGRRAFEGDNTASLIGSILHHQPEPVSQVATVAPPQLDRLVQACLVKDPDDRVQSAHDVKLQLQWMSEEGGSAASHPGNIAAPVAQRSSRLSTVIVAVVAALIGASAVFLSMGRSEREVTAPQLFQVGRWDLQPQSAPVFSPDGQSIAFSVREGMDRQIHRRELGTFDTIAIAGTEDGQGPFFSPDGRWIGFVTPSAVMKVPAEGGIPQTVAQIPGVSSGTWAPDGQIYLALLDGGDDGATALVSVPASGGQVRTVGKLDESQEEGDAWLPEVLPDGKTVLVSIYGGSQGAWRLVAFSPGGTRKVVVSDGFLGRYSPRGQLLYQDGESQAVVAAPFDPGTLTVTGGAIVLTEIVDGSFCYDISDDGALAYVLAPVADEGRQVVWLNPDGNTQTAAEMSASWAQPRLSPDGRRVVLRRTASNCELWMLDIGRATLSRILQGQDAHDPIWSPDGRRVAFRNNAVNEMVAMTVDGLRGTSSLHPDANRGTPESWGGEGLLAYTQSGRGTLSDIWVLRTNEGSPPEPFAVSSANESGPAVSPNGRWIAYVSDETGTPEVLLRAWPDEGSAWQISAGGGTDPLWSRDGSRLYYVVGQKMMSIPVETEPDVSLGTAVEVFDGEFSTARARDFDVAADGRVVTISQVGGEAGRKLRILLDWPEKLARLSAARG